MRRNHCGITSGPPILTHRFVALETELFAEGGVGVAGGVLVADGELEFAAAAAADWGTESRSVGCMVGSGIGEFRQ